jgi:hypothetical protein
LKSLLILIKYFSSKCGIFDFKNFIGIYAFGKYVPSSKTLKHFNSGFFNSSTINLKYLQFNNFYNLRKRLNFIEKYWNNKRFKFWFGRDNT